MIYELNLLYYSGRSKIDESIDIVKVLLFVIALLSIHSIG